MEGVHLYMFLKIMCMHYFYDKIILRARQGRTQKNESIRNNIIQIWLTTCPWSVLFIFSDVTPKWWVFLLNPGCSWVLSVLLCLPPSPLDLYWTYSPLSRLSPDKLICPTPSEFTYHLCAKDSQIYFSAQTPFLSPRSINLITLKKSVPHTQHAQNKTILLSSNNPILL